MSDRESGIDMMHEHRLGNALERLRAVHDEIIRGVAHAMSNRVASLSAGLYLLGEHGTVSATSIAALQSELDRMEQLLVQLRMLPRENVPAEPLLALESARTAAALHEHHGEMRNVTCEVQDVGTVPPARAEPQALLHALLLAINTAKQSAGSGRARLILDVEHNIVRFTATSDMGSADIAPDNSVFSAEATAANWLVVPSGGRAYAIATGCVVEVPTLASTRSSR